MVPIYYVYDGHGSVRALHTSTTLSSPTPNNYLYSGEQFDPDLHLYYNRARYLNVSTGRFWSMDSDEGTDVDPLSLHKYLYTEGEPVTGIDPSGNDDLADITAGFGVSETLDTMPVPQPTNANQKLGIGIEVPKAQLSRTTYTTLQLIQAMPSFTSRNLTSFFQF